MTGFFKDVADSFYRREFYARLAAERRGLGLRYVLFLTLFMLLAYGAAFGRDGYPELRDTVRRLPALLETFPAMKVADGKLSIDKPSPYEVSLGDEKGKTYKIVIDTGYKYDSAEALAETMQRQNIVMLLTENEVITLKNERQLQINSLKDTAPFEVRHEDWQRWGQKAEAWGITLILGLAAVAGFIFFWLMNLIVALLCGIVVWLLGAVARAGFDFEAAVRLASAARVPLIVIALLPLFAGFGEITGLFYWLLWAFYMIFAALAARQKAAPPAAAGPAP